MKICLDPGHGGNDSGAIGPAGLEEAATNLAITLELEQELEKWDHEILLTRATDVFVELDERCDMANDWGADYFISIHCNSNGPSAVGIETLYTSDAGMDLAEPIQKSLIKWTRDVDRGLKERNDLAVLNGTQMPAILIEVGFISHPETEQKLSTRGYRFVLATAILSGLHEFLGMDDIPPLA